MESVEIAFNIIEDLHVIVWLGSEEKTAPSVRFCYILIKHFSVREILTQTIAS